jgi:bacterioferritin-associated ferredoxin
MLDHEGVRKMLPDIGPAVVGGFYCPKDGMSTRFGFWPRSIAGCRSLASIIGRHIGSKRSFQKARAFVFRVPGATSPARLWRKQREWARKTRGRGFIDRLYRPAKQFRIPEDPTTVVCRCEDVTAGRIRQTIADRCSGPNQLKSFTRCGMGACQGRLCGVTVTEMISDVQEVAPAEVGYFRLRPPVKPVTLAELAALHRQGPQPE